MAFESIDVNNLRSSLNSCKNSLNNSFSESLVPCIINDNVWLCDCRNNLKEALLKLNSVYVEIGDLINKFLDVTDKIDSYKVLASENVSLEKEYSILKDKLYYTETYDSQYYNESTQTWETRKNTRTVKNLSVENQLNNIRKKINENKNDMQHLKNVISSSL